MKDVTHWLCSNLDDLTLQYKPFMHAKTVEYSFYWHKEAGKHALYLLIL